MLSLGLVLELKPTKVVFKQDDYELYENFTCLYHAYEPYHIWFTIEPESVKDDDPLALMDVRLPYNTEEYRNGEKHFITLRLINGHRTVTCRVFDEKNMEVAQMVSQIIYIGGGRRARESQVAVIYIYVGFIHNSCVFIICSGLLFCFSVFWTTYGHLHLLHMHISFEDWRYSFHSLIEYYDHSRGM